MPQIDLIISNYPNYFIFNKNKNDYLYNRNWYIAYFNSKHENHREDGHARIWDSSTKEY
jgi:hypothetical protein